MLKSFNTPAMQARRAQAGITLIEVSIGLIIAAIIAAAAFIAFQNNSRRTEIRENISNITEVTAEIKNKFLRTNSYGVLDQENAVRAGVFAPLGSVDTIGNTATNSYGGNVAIDDGELSWAGIPEDQCVDLVLGVESGFQQLSINGTLLERNPAEPTDPTFITQIEDACVGENIVLGMRIQEATAP